MKMRSQSNSSSEEAENVYTVKGKDQQLVRVINRSKSNSSSGGSLEKEKSYKPSLKQQRERGKRKGSTSGSPKIGLQNQRGRQGPAKNR